MRPCLTPLLLATCSVSVQPQATTETRRCLPCVQFFTRLATCKRTPASPCEPNIRAMPFRSFFFDWQTKAGVQPDTCKFSTASKLHERPTRWHRHCFVTPIPVASSAECSWLALTAHGIFSILPIPCPLIPGRILYTPAGYHLHPLNWKTKQSEWLLARGRSVRFTHHQCGTTTIMVRRRWLASTSKCHTLVTATLRLSNKNQMLSSPNTWA